jgi:hypothetical protein
MSQLSIIGLFCEDIREEKGDSLSLIGLMPDNINLEISDAQANAPSSENRILSKVCIFARANFPPDESVRAIELNLLLPNDVEIPVGGAAADVIETAKTQARDMGAPLAGVVMRVVLAGFRLPKPGIVQLKAKIDGKERILSMLNFKFNQPTSSTAR